MSVSLKEARPRMYWLIVFSLQHSVNCVKYGDDKSDWKQSNSTKSDWKHEEFYQEWVETRAILPGVTGNTSNSTKSDWKHEQFYQV